MADHRSAPNRRPLITGVVAACVLCGIWFLPTAHAGDEQGPTEHSGSQHEERDSTADSAGH